MRSLRRHQYRFGQPLPEAEQRIVTDGLGRFARDERERRRAIALTAAYRNQSIWLTCDCRQVNGRPPLLFPVRGGGIQREDRGEGTEHDHFCAFARNPEEQNRLNASYRRPEPRADGSFRFSLVNQATNDGDRRPGRERLSRGRSRPRLGKLLTALFSAAGLAELSIDAGPLPQRDDQFQKIRRAARLFEIADGQRLDRWLATSRIEYFTLLERLRREDQKDWGRSMPHGYYIDTFTRIINGKPLYGRDGDYGLDVIGKSSVFGENQTVMDSYHVAVYLIGPNVDGIQKPLRSYAHPCASYDHLMLLDSGYERTTLSILRQCTRWLNGKFGIEATIYKPLFDVPPCDDTPDRLEVCRPDFMVKSTGPAIRNGLILVETMGYPDPSYRERKEAMRPMFERIELAGAQPGVHLAIHDLCKPQPKVERDRFFDEVRWSITQLKTQPVP